MEDWYERSARPSLIPHRRRDITPEWATCLLTSHLGDDVTVEELSAIQDECDHAVLYRVAFECNFSSEDTREVSPPLTGDVVDGGHFPLKFTGSIDTDAESEGACAPSDHAVIEELESISLPQGAAAHPEGDIQLLISEEGEENGGKSPTFYLSSSDEEDNGLLPPIVTFPGSRGPSSASPQSDSESNEQTDNRKFLWVVKLPPRDPFAKLFSEQGLSRDRELALFSLIAPKIEMLAAPGCIYCETDDDDEVEGTHWVLVVEDVWSQGGTSLPEPLTREMVARVVDMLANTAALFLRFQHLLSITEGRHVADVYPALRPSELELGRHRLSSDHAGACLREISTFLQPSDPDLAAWLLAKTDRAMESFLRLSEIDYDNDAAVIVNGLCSLENLIVTEGDRLLLMNWHRCRYSRLTFDLTYFLLTSTSLQFRRAYAESLLDRFNLALKTQLQELEVPIPTGLNPEDIKKDFEQSKALVLLWAGTDLCRKLEHLEHSYPRHFAHSADTTSAAVDRSNHEEPNKGSEIRGCEGPENPDELDGMGVKGTLNREKLDILKRLRDIVEDVRDVDVL